MTSMLVFLLTNNISGVALGRFILLGFFIHITKMMVMDRYNFDIDDAKTTMKKINIDVYTQKAHLINFAVLISQFIRALM